MTARSRIWTVFACALPFSSMGQVIDWSALIGSTRQDPVVLSGTRQVELATNDRMPYLWKELEARWESKRGDLKQQTASVRLEPLSWGEHSAFTRIRSQRETNSVLHLDNARSKALLERWRLGLRWLYQNRQLRYHREVAQLYADRVRVETRLAGDPRFDPQDLVNSMQLRVESEGDAQGDTTDIVEIENSLRSLCGIDGLVSLDTALAPLPRVQEALASLPASPDSTFPEWKSDISKLQLSESKFALDRSKAYSVLTYLEAGWEWDRTVQSKTDALNRATWQNLSFGAGVRIPLFDGQTSDLARSRGDLEAVKGDFLEHRRDLALHYATLKAEIGSMIRRKATIDSFATKVDAGLLFADYAKRADSDPLLVLKAKASSLDAQWKSEKLRFEIHLAFVEILALTGRLEDGTNRILATRP